MDNLQLNIDQIIDGLVVEIAQLKRDLVIEKARTAALLEKQEAEKTAASE